VAQLARAAPNLIFDDKKKFEEKLKL